MSAPTVSDESLVARIPHGDSAAFDEIVARYAHRVHGICFRYFGNAEDAEDATQETFVTVLRRAETFAGTASFSTWLYRVATNTCNDVARRRSRRPRTVPIEDRHESPDRGIEDLLLASESRSSLSTALAALEPAQRRAILAHDVVGEPYESIAEREGVAVGTVKSRIHRGHARLAALLDDTAAEPSRTPRPQTR